MRLSFRKEALASLYDRVESCLDVQRMLSSIGGQKIGHEDIEALQDLFEVSDAKPPAELVPMRQVSRECHHKFVVFLDHLCVHQSRDRVPSLRSFVSRHFQSPDDLHHGIKTSVTIPKIFQYSILSSMLEVFFQSL